MSAKTIMAVLLAILFAAYVAVGLLSPEMAATLGIPAAVTAAIGLAYASWRR